MAALMKCLWFTMAMFLLSERAMQQAQAWSYAHATYYGGADASGTNNGACGYSNVFALGYGTLTAALSTPLFADGLACGACFQIMCSGSSSCYNGNSIVVTATNLCPQGSFGGWCDFPNYHFDLSQPAFSQIAAPVAGHVDLQYQRVSCVRSGGIKFQAQGHTYFLQVLVYNVGGMGDVTALQVKGFGGWTPMIRGWGQIWQTATILDGQSLSFAVTTSDGKSVTSNDVCGNYWQYGQTFSGSQF
ncbi:unnamed protein product [Calypogeia fissa]